MAIDSLKKHARFGYVLLAAVLLVIFISAYGGSQPEIITVYTALEDDQIPAYPFPTH